MADYLNANIPVSNGGQTFQSVAIRALGPNVLGRTSVIDDLTITGGVLAAGAINCTSVQATTGTFQNIVGQNSVQVYAYTDVGDSNNVVSTSNATAGSPFPALFGGTFVRYVDLNNLLITAPAPLSYQFTATNAALPYLTVRLGLQLLINNSVVGGPIVGIRPVIAQAGNVALKVFLSSGTDYSEFDPPNDQGAVFNYQFVVKGMITGPTSAPLTIQFASRSAAALPVVVGGYLVDLQELNRSATP